MHLCTRWDIQMYRHKDAAVVGRGPINLHTGLRYPAPSRSTFSPEGRGGMSELCLCPSVPLHRQACSNETVGLDPTALGQ